MPNPDGTPTALELKIAEVKAKAEAAKAAAQAPAHTPEQIAAMPAMPIPMGTPPASPIPIGPPATPVAALAPATVPLAQTLPVVSVQAPAEIPALVVGAGASTEKTKGTRKPRTIDAGAVRTFEQEMTAQPADGVRVTLTITGPAADLARILAGLGA